MKRKEGTTSSPMASGSLCLAMERVVYLGVEFTEGEGGGREEIGVEEREHEVYMGDGVGRE